MVRGEYGNGKVKVTYSRRRNMSGSSCGSSCSGYSTARFYSALDSVLSITVQLRITKVTSTALMELLH